MIISCSLIWFVPFCVWWSVCRLAWAPSAACLMHQVHMQLRWWPSSPAGCSLASWPARLGGPDALLNAWHGNRVQSLGLQLNPWVPLEEKLIFLISPSAHCARVDRADSISLRAVTVPRPLHSSHWSSQQPCEIDLNCSLCLKKGLYSDFK